MKPNLLNFYRLSPAPASGTAGVTKGLILSGLLFFSACQQPPVAEYEVIPQPREISYTPGFFKMSDRPVIAFSRDLNNEARLLQAALARDFSINATLKEDKKGDINLVLDTTVLPDKPEGYRLEVTSGKVNIRASSPAGILNGVQTLRQIIRKEEEGKYSIQKAEIDDYPAFSWRAFMLDEGRYFKGKEVVKKLLDEMSALKMNVFHWHLTNDQGWRIEIKKYPKLTEIGAFRDSSEINHFESNLYDGKPHGGFYTQEEIKEIVDYAARRHITIIPEISMPGHSAPPSPPTPGWGRAASRSRSPASSAYIMRS